MRGEAGGQVLRAPEDTQLPTAHLRQCVGGKQRDKATDSRKTKFVQVSFLDVMKNLLSTSVMKGGVYVVTGAELHLPSQVGKQRIRPQTHVTWKKMKVNTNIVCYKHEPPVGEKQDGDCLW